MEKINPGISTESKPTGMNLQKNLLLIISASILFIVGLLARDRLHDFPLHYPEYAIFLLAYLLVGSKVLKNAALHVFHGHIFDENFLMTTATLGAIFIHQLPEAVGVMLFFSVGEYMENVSVDRSRRSIKALLELRPEYAVVKGEPEKKVDPSEVKVGDSIIIKPGERVPLDGVVVEGVSTVGTSALTGESLPREVGPESEVLAGYTNKTGVITVRVTRRYGESALSRILNLVENASARKAATQKFITRFAQIYSPSVVSVAFIIAVIPPLMLKTEFYPWVYRALVLLVISCPCALVISIPLTYFAGIGKASREGILMKGANFLDALAQLKVVAFDKTGTLTEGKFTVSRVVPTNSFTEEEVLEYASLTETHSNHPIARSIVEAYKEDKITKTVTDYKEIPARGVSARINGVSVFVGNDRQLHEEVIAHDTCHVEGTVAHVTVNNVYAGYIVISDGVRPDALETVKTLRAAGITVVMLTGDGKDAAECVAQHLGIHRFYCELLPEEKVKRVEEIQKDMENGKIAFVGDGINDAPVIARADVGMAMGGLGSDAAVETADVVIMGDTLHKIVEAVNIARKTHKIVWENIFLVLVVKGIFIFIGALGIATMWEAVFADVGVALMAVFNSTRVFRR